MFSTKDKIPNTSKSFVIYKFVCASYNACYIVRNHQASKYKDKRASRVRQAVTYI